MMAVRLLDAGEILRILEDGPGKIDAATTRASDEMLAERPSPNEWSPNEILAHLRACQDVWGDVRVVRMLEDDHPVLRAVNPRTWLEQTDYRGLPFGRSLGAFTEQRRRFVSLVSSLTPDQWSRDGTFTGGGKSRTYTVHTEMDALARHERSHIRQLERLLGR